MKLRRALSLPRSLCRSLICARASTKTLKRRLPLSGWFGSAWDPPVSRIVVSCANPRTGTYREHRGGFVVACPNSANIFIRVASAIAQPPSSDRECLYGRDDNDSISLGLFESFSDAANPLSEVAAKARAKALNNDYEEEDFYRGQQHG